MHTIVATGIGYASSISYFGSKAFALHVDLGRKDRDSPSVLDCDGSFDFGENGELAGCEELAKFLQATHYKRRTYYGIWKKKQIASRLAKWAAG